MDDRWSNYPPDVGERMRHREAIYEQCEAAVIYLEIIARFARLGDDDGLNQAVGNFAHNARAIINENNRLVALTEQEKT